MWTVLLLLACARRGSGAAVVDCDGGAAWSDIQSAVDDATSGDTIAVAPCEYHGTVNFKGKAVSIYATGGPSVTTIVAEPGRAAIEVDDGESAGTRLSGFTITGGGGVDIPAIDVEFSSLVLDDVTVTGNEGTNTVYTRSGHVVLRNSRVYGNTTTEGIVVRARRGMIAVVDSTISCGGQVGYSAEHGGGFVDGAVFDCPGDTAISAFHGENRVQRTRVDGLVAVENEGPGSEGTIVENSVLLGGATVTSSDLTLRNVLSRGTVKATGGTLTVASGVITGASCGIEADGSSSVDVRHTVFWGNDEDACGIESPVGQQSNVAADPKLGEDGRPGPGSPCLDAGPDEADWADPDGTRNDIGAFGGPLGGPGMRP